VKFRFSPEERRVPFRLRYEQHANSFGKDPTTWVIEDDAGNRLDVWPALGANAFRWNASGVDLFDCDPTFFEIQKPTRSGFPILFPFPNRIRAGRFSWAGVDYKLPENGPGGKNAIHGFTLNEGWNAAVALLPDSAVLTASYDLVAVAGRWPATATIEVEYRLSANVLEVVAEVKSHDQPLPFGLGYHPYFAVAPFGGDDAIVTLAADQLLEQRDNLPTGARAASPAEKDLREGQRFGNLTLDDAYTSLRAGPGPGRLGWFAGLRSPVSARRLDIYVSPEFREAVVFTPPHRRAIALEPYTCMSDAINLEQRGVDAGWLELPPNNSWSATVRLEFTE
jgi:aldose 1-epimerase